MTKCQLGKRFAAASLSTLLSIFAVSTSTTPAPACPFCGTVTQTLGEEMGGAAAVILAHIVVDKDATAQADDASDAGAASSPTVQPKTRFHIDRVLKGDDRLKDADEIEVLFFGQPKRDATYLVIAVDGPSLEWATPIVLTDDAVEYVSKLLDLPAQGADRLAFFQEYFEHADPMLAQDAYDEFAKAPYAEVRELKDRMYHDKYVGWIKNTDLVSSRRRLYFTLLGICGNETDVPMLAEMIQSDNREAKTALDALIACYLSLAGNDGMPLVEERFLANADAEYTDTYAAIMALRFLGQEQDKIDRDRLLAAMRLMLDRPTLADLVIPDLARWEDWSVADRLVTLYKEADADTSWVRVPVIHYLRAMNSKVDAYLKELAEIDPDAYKRANTFFPIQAANKPVPPAAATNASGTADKAATDTAAAAAASDTAPANESSDSAKTVPAGDNKDAPVTTSQAAPAPTDQSATEPDQLAAADGSPADKSDESGGTADGPAASDAPAETASEPTADKTNGDAEIENASPKPVAEEGHGAGESHGEHSATPAVVDSRLTLLLPVAGVMLFAVFALLLLGGRQSSQQG